MMAQRQRLGLAQKVMIVLLAVFVFAAFAATVYGTAVMARFILQG